MDFVWVTEAALEGLLDFDPLPEADVPVLLVHGEDEMPMVVRMMQAWATRSPNVRLEVVSDAGHLPHNDNPASFNAVLRAFLAQLES
jgi:pimeloyl-ACP methyl ester carboxylesterase